MKSTSIRIKSDLIDLIKKYQLTQSLKQHNEQGPYKFKLFVEFNTEFLKMFETLLKNNWCFL